MDLNWNSSASRNTIAFGLKLLAGILVALSIVLIVMVSLLLRQAGKEKADFTSTFAQYGIRFALPRLSDIASEYDPASPRRKQEIADLLNVREEINRLVALVRQNYGAGSAASADGRVRGSLYVALARKWDVGRTQIEQLIEAPTTQAARPIQRSLAENLKSMAGLLATDETLTNISTGTEVSNYIQAVLALVVFLVAALIFLRGKDIATRTARLTETVQKIAAGDINLRAEVKGQDELGAIAEAFNEMTEQVHVQLEKEGRFFTLSSHLLCVIGFDGRFLRMSQAWENVLGRSQSELLGAPLEGFLHGEDRDETMASISRLIKSGKEITRLENRCVSASGQVNWLSWNLKPVPGDQLIYGIAMEITQRRQAERDREKLIDSIEEGTVRLAGATSGVVTSANQQAHGAQEQAAAIAQTVAAVEEVEQTTRQAAARAAAVAESSQLALETGRAGRKAVEETISAMERVRQEVESIAQNILTLAEQAQNIGEIVTSVDHIADQTNLLALNAAIEAARAGEQGKGFTVVANEIRLLADQSKRATVQVRQMLSGIQKLTQRSVLSMEEGTRSVSAATTVVTRADDTIKELVETVNLAATSAVQIVTSANQQSVGMKQIHQAMKNIQEITNETLSATQRAQAAVNELNLLAESMKSMLQSNGHAVVLQ